MAEFCSIEALFIFRTAVLCEPSEWDVFTHVGAHGVNAELRLVVVILVKLCQPNPARARNWTHGFTAHFVL